jgi:hypothetical protein
MQQSRQKARVLARISLAILVPVAIFAGFSGHVWVTAGFAVAALVTVPRAI